MATKTPNTPGRAPTANDSTPVWDLRDRLGFGTPAYDKWVADIRERYPENIANQIIP